jgi:MFS family permease
VVADAKTNRYQCPYRDTSVLDLMPGALIGLNVGLAAGLLGAYLPDQTKYGPSWKRILLVDLAAGAGVVAGGVGGCIANVNGCLSNKLPNEQARAIAALAAIGGGIAGMIGGVLLTRHYDDEPAPPASADRPKASFSTTLIPLRGLDGGVTPGLGTFGSF